MFISEREVSGMGREGKGTEDRRFVHCNELTRDNTLEIEFYLGDFRLISNGTITHGFDETGKS